MVEFALIAPIFFLLLFAVIQLGLLFGAQNGLVDAVRDSTRRAATYRVNGLSLDPNNNGGNTLAGICTAVAGEVESRVSERIPGFVAGDMDPPEIGYEWMSNNDSPQTFFLVAHVTVRYHHPLYVPLVSFFLDGADGIPNDGRLMLEASEQMRVENPDLLTIGTNTNC